MENEQEREWEEAQKIALSVDLVDTAKNMIKFLAAVDRNRYLYEGPALERAIYRYNNFWLPLLDKHLKSPILDDQLVIPLDCEWIWHCHRLSPVTYKSDCEKLFGRVLGNNNIISSIQGTSRSKTEEIWNTIYPDEPYELDYNIQFQDFIEKRVPSVKTTDYDLVDAVKRQSSFYYQVSKPHFSTDQFLQEASARYKGFLHLIVLNKKKNIKRSSVPTYDIDLLWHSHQSAPVSYCNDLVKLLGYVMQHDDTDTDRSKGGKLDTGFRNITEHWEKAYGFSYLQAGGMYSGPIPTPVTQIPFPYFYEGKTFHEPENCDKLISLSMREVVEVHIEILEIKNLPAAYKGNICVSFSKMQPNMTYTIKKILTILSECGEKQVAAFQCEPTTKFLFEVMYNNNVSSDEPIMPDSLKVFGSCSFSFQECMASESQLRTKKWLIVVKEPEILASDPILLHVSLSFTPPMKAHKVFHFLQPESFYEGSYFLKPPQIKKVKQDKVKTYVIDDCGNVVLDLQTSNDMSTSTHGLIKEVFHVTKSGVTHTLAEFHGSEWVMHGSHGPLNLRCASQNHDHLFELIGHKMVRLYTGRKLEFEPAQYEKRSEQDFMTAIEFSAKYPYGRVVALVDFKHGIFKVMKEWMIQTCITLVFILSDTLRREGRFAAKIDCDEIVEKTKYVGNGEALESMAN